MSHMPAHVLRSKHSSIAAAPLAAQAKEELTPSAPATDKDPFAKGEGANRAERRRSWFGNRSSTPRAPDPTRAEKKRKRKLQAAGRKAARKGR